jgi:head-tail adaptor
MTRVHLNRRLVLETRERTADGAGGYHEVWRPLGVIWAEIRGGTGREREGAGTATLSSVPYRITVRASPTGAPSRPRPDQRFRDGERIFRILAVAERDHEARYLECAAREEVAA